MEGPCSGASTRQGCAPSTRAMLAKQVGGESVSRGPQNRPQETRGTSLRVLLETGTWSFGDLGAWPFPELTTVQAELSRVARDMVRACSMLTPIDEVFKMCKRLLSGRLCQRVRGSSVWIATTMERACGFAFGIGDIQMGIRMAQLAIIQWRHVGMPAAHCQSSIGRAILDALRICMLSPECKFGEVADTLLALASTLGVSSCISGRRCGSVFWERVCPSDGTARCSSTRLARGATSGFH